jgi:hypothetical protein
VALGCLVPATEALSGLQVSGQPSQPQWSPKPQSAGRCVVEARGGALSPSAAGGWVAGGWVAGGRPRSLRREAAAASPPALARTPRSGQHKWPSPHGDSFAAAEPGAWGRDPKEPSAGGATRDVRAFGERAEGAYPAGRRLSVCSSVPAPSASAAGC